MKYTTKDASGYFEDDPANIYTVTIALEEWDGIEDHEDESIFFYMDGQPLISGAIVADNFIITEVKG